MPQPKSLIAYAGIRELLLRARAAGGIRFTPKHSVSGLPSRGTAINWKQKIYSYRKLLLQADAEGKPPGYTPKTEWDDLFVSFDKDSNETVLLIQFGIATAGDVESLDGRPVPAAPVEDLPADDPVVAEALALLEDKAG